MLDIDASKLTPKIAQIMSLVGWGIPPLDWTERHNTTAKTILDENEDVALFKSQTIKDEAMATAVRALLYLWTGWPSDCQMWAVAAPDKERFYVMGLSYRQLRKLDESKSQLQQLVENPLSDGLARLSKELISDHADILLKRFRDLIELGQAWEAFAFSDLLEQARDGEFNHGAQEILRKLQWQEFNMLFQRSYEAATGVDITKRDAQAKQISKEPAWKRNQVQQHRTRPPASAPSKPSPAESRKGSDSKSEKETEKEDNKSSKIRLKCPKCKSATTVSESARGHSVKCVKCSHLLHVASKTDETKATERKTAKLICPKCHNAASYSLAHRGKKVACLKCRTSFMFAAA